MIGWVALLVVSLVGLGVAWRRTASRNIDTGQVSEGWLRTQRAEKRDPFTP
jgi:hypothetical protein